MAPLLTECREESLKKTSLVHFHPSVTYTVRWKFSECSPLKRKHMMSWVVKLKSVGRVVPLLLLLVTMMGPWFIDTHPATENSCSPPLVWLGNGYCACLVSFMAALRLSLNPGHYMLWLVCLPLALPFLSTGLFILYGVDRQLWIFHLTAWALVAIYSLTMFIGRWYSYSAVIIWGAGLGGIVAVFTLVGEILVGNSKS